MSNVWLLICLHDLDVCTLHVISVYLLNAWDGWVVKIFMGSCFNYWFTPPPPHTLLRSLPFLLVIPTIGIRAKFLEEEALQLRGKILKWKSTNCERLLRTKRLKYISYYINWMKLEMLWSVLWREGKRLLLQRMTYYRKR